MMDDTMEDQEPEVVASSSSEAPKGNLAERIEQMLMEDREHPPALTNAGPGLNTLLMILGVLYIATLHARAVKRN